MIIKALDKDFLDRVEDTIPQIRRAAHLLVNETQEADDLVEASLKYALSVGEYGATERQTYHWLLKIFWQTYKNQRQQSNGSGRSQVTHVPNGKERSSRDRVGWETFVDSDSIESAYHDLSSEDREMILLIAICGLRYEEAAHVLDITDDEARSRFWEAHRNLNAAIADSDKPVRPAEIINGDRNGVEGRLDIHNC